MLFTWTIFYSSSELFQQMLLKQIYCCGTVRLNRRGMPEAIKAAKRKKRGQTITMQKGNLVATVWKDKKMVTYSSTNCDPTQQRIVQRRQKDGTRRDVPAPVASELYNKFIFGVDLADQKRMQYSTCRKTKK
jgi:5-formyltetrahydrofolate cyclo-ligase